MKISSLIKKAQKNVIKNLCVFSFKNTVSINNLINRYLVGVSGYYSFIEGEDYSTLIIGSDYVDLIKDKFKSNILAESIGVAAISYEFGKDVMTTVGVLASLLAEYKAKEINIIEFYTSYLEAIVLINLKDLVKL